MKQRPFNFSFSVFCLASAFFILFSRNTLAQVTLSTRSQNRGLQHGIEQYKQGHFALAAATLSSYLKEEAAPTARQAAPVITADHQKATYYLALSNIKGEARNGVEQAELFVLQSANLTHRQGVAFALAQYFFQRNDLAAAIPYYEIAGIDNLSNEEIADAKFELAYSYFNQEQFDKAKPLFLAIKDLPNHKYYIPGNYYYGLLAYNDKDYKEALSSFERIHHESSYKDIVPYYEAEIYYFLGDHDRVLQISRNYLNSRDTLFYENNMQLLTAQTLFEQKKFKEALPYFEKYYQNTDKIRKEELYELAYSYYRVENWKEAIRKFQPLSNARDSLGQTSMYLLGDCYLKINDKKGARNAFGICADMDFNASQKEAAAFLYAKLSVELGDEALATRKLYAFLQKYPDSNFSTEARNILSALLAKTSNYAEAFGIMSDMAVKDNNTWRLYQQVSVGRAMQLLQNKNFHAADSVLNLSLQQPVNPAYEAITYFWKGEIAYAEQHFDQAVQFSQTFLDKVKGREAEVRDISSAATVQHARMNIGYAQLELQRFKEAGEYFAAAHQSGPAGSDNAIKADALLREADALFMQKEFEQASGLYDKAIAANVPDPDYARFQKSIIYGLLGKGSAQKEILSSLIARQPASAYRDDAQYELALTYLAEGNNGEAISLLKSLSERAAPVNLKSAALLKLAYAYRQNGDHEDAVARYQEYIATYPSASDRQDALNALRSLYISQGAPEQYAEYLRKENLPMADEETLENTYYDAATQDYGNAAWERAASGFSKYLERFPKGKYAAKAHFYRGESYYNLKDYDQALKDYEAVQSAGWSDYSEEAAGKAARISYSKGDYDRAMANYEELRNTAMNDQGLATAYEGLMKSAFANKQYQQAAAFADTLLSLPDAGKQVTAEAELIQAKTLQQNRQFEAAIALYQVLDRKNLGTVSAEARYRHAEVLFEQQKFNEAEARASYAAQASGGYDYWVVKCYILLADILMEEKDYFNAKATLRSIVKNTKIKELKDEAEQKLAQVTALEKAKSKLEEN